jgi:charged multivesicular body protein 4
LEISVALQAVQKKKRFERQLQQLDGALTTLEAQLEILESANTNTLAVASMEKASKALKATQKDLDVAKVEQILDEMAAQREVAGEIADAISQPVGFEDDFDEDELERELQELEDLEDSSVDRLLPTVPQGDIKDKAAKSKLREPSPT